jgi:simple sugar transport system permease protein
VSLSVFLFAALVRSTPLVLLGLAVALAFRAKLLNIGAEGQLLAGASAAVAVGLACSSWPGAVLVPAELIAGAVAGAVWAGIAAVLRERFGVLEVISTLMLNFIAQNLVSYLVRGPMQEPTRIYPQTAALTNAARLPVLVSGQRLHLGFVLAVVLAVALWWMLRSTATGFRVRAVGDGAAAAASAGRVSVSRVVFGVFLASGALAGLGGSVEASGVTFALYEGISPGYGYTAIAVALLARLNPLLVILAGIFFGALEAGAATMQRDAGVPAVLVTAIEAIVILGVLAASHARTIGAARAQLSAVAPPVEHA